MLGGGVNEKPKMDVVPSLSAFCGYHRGVRLRICTRKENRTAACVVLGGSRRCFQIARKYTRGPARGRLQVSGPYWGCVQGESPRTPAPRGGVPRAVVPNELCLSPAVHLSPGVFLSLSVFWCLGCSGRGVCHNLAPVLFPLVSPPVSLDVCVGGGFPLGSLAPSHTQPCLSVGPLPFSLGPVAGL